jgi:hypothetical protein
MRANEDKIAQLLDKVRVHVAAGDSVSELMPPRSL